MRRCRLGGDIHRSERAIHNFVTNSISIGKAVGRQWEAVVDRGWRWADGGGAVNVGAVGGGAMGGKVVGRQREAVGGSGRHYGAPQPRAKHNPLRAP